MLKKCLICSSEFHTNIKHQKLCGSKGCHSTHKNNRKRKCHKENPEKYRAYRREYRKRPEVQERQKLEVRERWIKIKGDKDKHEEYKEKTKIRHKNRSPEKIKQDQERRRKEFLRSKNHCKCGKKKSKLSEVCLDCRVGPYKIRLNSKEYYLKRFEVIGWDVIRKGSDYKGVISNGYRYMWARKFVPSHHIAWILKTGEYPKKGLVIDHIDENKTNNSFKNLRQVTLQENTRSHFRRKKAGITLPLELG